MLPPGTLAGGPWLLLSRHLATTLCCCPAAAALRLAFALGLPPLLLSLLLLHTLGALAPRLILLL